MAHIYATDIDNYDGLNAVAIAISNITYDRFLCVVNQKSRFGLVNVLSLDAEVMAVTSKLKADYAKLMELSDFFNKVFVHPNNHAFSTAHQLLNTIRSGSSELKKILQFFTPNNAASVPHLPEGKSKPLIYTRSQLTNAEYTPSLFPEDIVPEVKQLFQHLSEFFELLETAINLCKAIILEEEDIRKDPSLCQEIYNAFKQNQYQRLMPVISKIDKSILHITNSAIELRNKCKSEAEFSQKAYHNVKFNDAIQLASKEIAEEAINQHCSPDEVALFGENYDKINKVRIIIQNFDSILENLTKKNNIPAEAIASLLVWSKPIEKLKFYNYFKKTYKEAGGKRKLTSYFGMCNSSYEIERKKKYLEYVEKFERFN